MSENYYIYKTIKSIQDYLSCVSEINSSWYNPDELNNSSAIWYRGQSNDYPLLPKIFRKHKYKNSMHTYNEIKIVNTFRANYKNYISERFSNPIEEFSFMQHYGVPTRLLDWTEMPLTALYFAVMEYSNVDIEDQIPTIWIMSVGKLNSITMNSEITGPLLSENQLIKIRFDLIGFVHDNFFDEDNFCQKYCKFKYNRDELNYPLAYYPISSSNMRISTQKGMFTIHGISTQPIDDVFSTTKSTDYLLKIVIDNKSVNNILSELNNLGYSEKSIYPDIQGLAEELKSTRYME